MKVVIVGAGNIGTSVAILLVARGAVAADDISFVDPSPDRVAVEIFGPRAFDRRRSGTGSKLAADIVVNCAGRKALDDLLWQDHAIDVLLDVCEEAPLEPIPSGCRVFVPHCGLSPGIVGDAVRNRIIDGYDWCCTILCGALPRTAAGPLVHSVHWSASGMASQYLAPPAVLVDGKIQELPSQRGVTKPAVVRCTPLEYRIVRGGLGNLLSIYESRRTSLEYGTLRWPGHHAELDRLLSANAKEIPRLLARNASPSGPDVVFAAVLGRNSRTGNAFVADLRLDGPFVVGTRAGQVAISAVEATTAWHVVSCVAHILERKDLPDGIVFHESFPWKDILTDDPLLRQLPHLVRPIGSFVLGGTGEAG